MLDAGRQVMSALCHKRKSTYQGYHALMSIGFSTAPPLSAQSLKVKFSLGERSRRLLLFVGPLRQIPTHVAKLSGSLD
jgi:hypothetical protein